MAFDINLTSGMRSNLVSLQNTTVLMSRTQGRLSSGKSVNAAVDDPSKFFAAADHTNHATDLAARKSDMGEAIQSVQQANNGMTAITSLISQAKGLAQQAQSANQTDRATLAGQFNTIRNQIDQLANDSGYNGKNFLKGTGNDLTVLFNEKGTSSLTITAFDGSSSGLGISVAASGLGVPTTFTAESMAANSASVANGVIYTLKHMGADTNVTVNQTVNVAAETAIASAVAFAIGATYTFLVSGSQTATNIVVSADMTTGTFNGTWSAGTDYTVAYSGQNVTITLLHATALAGDNKGIEVSYTDHNNLSAGMYTLNNGAGNSAGTIVIGGTTITGTVVVTYDAARNSLWGSDTSISNDLSSLETAVNTLRTQASTMAANLSVVTNRQNWSAGMINTLQTGADNLTLADMNEEGANLLALQTRQQLGIQALSMASQANQSVMRLFG